MCLPQVVYKGITQVPHGQAPRWKQAAGDSRPSGLRQSIIRSSFFITCMFVMYPVVSNFALAPRPWKRYVCIVQLVRHGNLHRLSRCNPPPQPVTGLFAVVIIISSNQVCGATSRSYVPVHVSEGSKGGSEAERGKERHQVKKKRRW